MVEVKNPTLEELAQNLYNEAGGMGNLYHAPQWLQVKYEERANEIMRSE